MEEKDIERNFFNFYVKAAFNLCAHKLIMAVNRELKNITKIKTAAKHFQQK